MNIKENTNNLLRKRLQLLGTDLLGSPHFCMPQLKKFKEFI